MVALTLSTKSVKEKAVQHEWHRIDAKGEVLGRVAPRIATILMGKHKSQYVPYLDMGDYVVVVNAGDVKLTGKKRYTKTYTRYSGYPGGLRSTTAQEMLSKKPEELVRHAVSGMLPKNKLRDRRLARLYIFTNEEHPYKEKFETRNPKSQRISKSK